MAMQVAIFRSYRLFHPSHEAGGGDPRDDYVETHAYAYEPIEPKLIVSDDSILDFWHGSGEVPYLIAELPEDYKWSGALGGVYHKGTGEALSAERLAAQAGADPGARRRTVRFRPHQGALT